MADYISQFTGGEIDRRLAKVSELEAGKQDKLVSGETIKTVGGQSILGEGNIPLTDQEAVKFTPQTLTDAQKAQALANIGAASEDEVAALADQKYEGPYESAAALPTASASTIGAIYLVGPDGNGEYDRYVTKLNGSTYTWGSLGKTSIDLSNYATKAEVGELEAKVDGFDETLDGTNWIHYNIQPGLTLGSSNDWRLSGAIKVKEGWTIKVNSAGNAVWALVACDSGGTITSGLVQMDGTSTDNKLYTYVVPSEMYVRISYKIAIAGSYAKMSADGIAKIVDDLGVAVNALDEKVEKKVDVSPGKNLYNPENDEVGKYINSVGAIANNASYNVSDFIAVTAGETYTLTGITNGTDVIPIAGNGAAYINFYDAGKVYLSSIEGNVKQITIPSGASFLRASILTSLTYPQIEAGNTRTEYEEYTPIGGYTAKINDGTISLGKLSAPLQNMVKYGNIKQFKSLSVNGWIYPGEFIKTDSVLIEKNTLLTAHIEGTIESVSVGMGKTDAGYTHYGHWVEITQTEVKLYWYDVSPTLRFTYEHGITLTQNTFVAIDSYISGTIKKTTLKLYNDEGAVYSKELPYWGLGAAFALNGNTNNALKVVVSLMPKDITKKIWLFGDSYISFVNDARWPYYFAQLNLTDWLSNNQPGLSPANAYIALQNLLALGFTPTYLVWTLGMNGPTTETLVDGNYVINSDQKAVIDDVVTTCGQYGIIPIFGTVPTVPTRQKTGFCNYIRSLGYRYIDFAKAVGADSAGNWTTGLLSGDGVHPTALGGKVLSAQVFADFPELGLND